MYTFDPEWLNWGAKGMEYSRESNLSSDAFPNHKYAQPKVIRKRKSLKKARKLCNSLTWMYAWKRLSLGHQVSSSLFISLGAQQGCQFWQISHIWHLTKDNLFKYQIWQDTNKENMIIFFRYQQLKKFSMDKYGRTFLKSEKNLYTAISGFLLLVLSWIKSPNESKKVWAGQTRSSIKSVQLVSPDLMN